MVTTAARPAVDEATQAPSRRAAAVAAVSDAASTLKSVTEEAAARLPGVAATGRSAYYDANRLIAASSDEMVRFGTAVSFGFAVGLLVGGANRVLVGAAFVPVCMLGLALLERSAAGRSGTAGMKDAGGL